MDHHTDISNSSNSSSIDNSNNIDNNNNNNNIHNTSTTTNIAGENDKSDTGNGNQPTGDESHDLMDQEEEEEEGDERPASTPAISHCLSSAPPSPASAMTMAPLTLATTTATTTTARPHSHLGPPPPLFASQLRSAVSFSSSLPSSLDRSPPNRSWPSVSPPARPGQSRRPDDPPATLPSWTRTPPKRDADPDQAKGLDPARHPACRRCRHPGADVRIVGCPSGCAFHARCLDLVAVCRRFSSPVVDGAGDDKVRLRTCPGCGRPAEGLEIVPLSFAEMDRARSALIGTRQGQKQGQEGEREEGAKEGAEKGGDAGNSHSTANTSRNVNHKRTRPQTATTDSSIPPYDPAAPRTGRWTDPELSFRDALLPPFLYGSLPLPNNLKLVDFLSSVLKSKPSRLTKKMKHARLSAKHYFVHSGFLRADDEAETLSRLEMEFLNSIPEEKEREEMRFHMQKEWRDHFAERCEYLRLEVDVRRWWKSVEEVEKRVQAEKEKRRREKRRFMMGKVLEGDVVESCGVGGIFVDGFGGGRVAGGGVGASDSSNGAATSRQPLVPDQNATNTPMGHGDNHRHNNNNGNTTATQHPHEGDPMEFDYDLVASALGSHPHHEGDDNVDFNKLYQSIVGDGDPHPHPHHDGHPHLLQSPPMTGLRDPIPNNNNNQSHHNHNQNNNSQRLHSTINHQHQNPSSTSLDSTHSSAASSDSPLLHAKYHHHHPHGIDDDRPPFFNSATQPNFQFAAPFLSILTSYIEQRRVPFEHVDLWVPSFSPHWNPKEPTAPLTSSLGSGSLAQGNGGGMGGDGAACRLCFAGSATVGVHLVEAKDDDGTERVVDGDASNDNTNEKDNDENDRQRKYHRMKCLPLSEDQIFNYSLFGSYSEKFSFSSGCGLPGRVYQSGIPAWEQFVMNAPPHLFERRGGAMQLGIKTALGLPIGSRTGNANSSVGRMVVVLYSRHNREKDEELVDRLMRDMRMVSPCPRWKLVVDVLPEQWNGDGNGTNGSGACASPGNLNGFVPDDGRCGGLSPPMGVFALNGHPSPRQQPPQPLQQNVIGNGGSGMGHPGVSSIPLSQQGGQQQQHPQPNSPQDPTKETKIQQLITLLGENMPSDPTSPLGQQLHSIMSLRLVLLRPSANRTPQEEHTIDTILLLMDSYVAANRDRSDIVLFLARDFAFHSMQMQQQAQHAVSGVGFLQMQQQQQQQQVQGRGILSPHHLSSHLQQQQQQQQAQFAMAQAPNFGQMKSNVQGNSTQHQQQQQQQQQQQLQNHHQQLQQQHMVLQKQALTTPIFGPFRG